MKLMKLQLLRLAALPMAFLLSGPAAGQALQSSQRFAFEAHPQDSLYLEAIRREADRLWTQITEDIGARPPGKITVLIAFSEEEFNRFQPENRPLPQWAVGVAYPARNAMVLRSPRLVPGHEEDLVEVFTHELTHLVLAERFGDHAVPRWLNEGLAMYEAYEWRPAQDVQMGKYVLSDQLIPLEELTQAFSRDAYGVRQAYLQSYSLVNHILSEYGRPAFHGLIERLSRGEAFEQAAPVALGVSLEELEAEWRRHLRFRYNLIPFLTSSTLLWVLITLVLTATYVQRKRRARKVLAQWAEEEAAAEEWRRED